MSHSFRKAVESVRITNVGSDEMWKATNIHSNLFHLGWHYQKMIKLKNPVKINKSSKCNGGRGDEQFLHRVRSQESGIIFSSCISLSSQLVSLPIPPFSHYDFIPTRDCFQPLSINKLWVRMEFHYGINYWQLLMPRNNTWVKLPFCSSRFIASFLPHISHYEKMLIVCIVKLVPFRFALVSSNSVPCLYQECMNYIAFIRNWRRDVRSKKIIFLSWSWRGNEKCLLHK